MKQPSDQTAAGKRRGTGVPDDGWKVLAEDEESENIPLWKALAQFTADDLDEGLQENAAVLNREKAVFQRNANISFVISLGFGVFFVVFLIGFLTLIRSKSAGTLLYIVLGLFVATIAPHIWRYGRQYGFKVLHAPLDLPHAADRHFDDFLGHLQRASGPQAYCFSRFRKKRRLLDRRQFFGRLRYYLCSEYSADRSMVIRFPAIFPVLTDIYLHRDDVRKMTAMRTPARKGGPGAKPKYLYEDAIIGLLGDSRLTDLDLRNGDEARRVISGWIVEWFANNGDASGDVPRTDYARVRDCAEKIYARLEKLSSSVRE